MSMVNNVCNLPEEIQNKIFFNSGLHVKDIVNVSRINEFFRSICNSTQANELWDNYAKQLNCAQLLIPLDSRKFISEYKANEKLVINIFKSYGPSDYFFSYMTSDSICYLKPFLNSDNPQIQYYLGMTFLEGFGIPKNFDIGMEFMERAAHQNFQKAIEKFLCKFDK